MHRRPGGLVGLQNGSDLLAELQRQHEQQQQRESQAARQSELQNDPLAFLNRPESLQQLQQDQRNGLLTGTPRPEYDNTDDSGMGTDFPDVDADEEELLLMETCSTSSSSEGDSEEDLSSEDDHPSTRTATSSAGSNTRRASQQAGWSRRTSNAGNEKNRRPSYTCHHGPPLPRGAPRIGRRAKPRPLRDIDVLQLAAGAACMVAPLTPELLR